MRRTSTWGAVGRGAAWIAALAVLWPQLVSAAPILRYDTTGPTAISTTGNTLGLAGSDGQPNANDGVGAFIDATGALQLAGWPAGTTDQWSLASSEAVLDLPPGAVIRYAELIWAGSVDASVLGSLGASITLTAPSGASYLIAPDPVTTPPAGAELNEGDYYARSANVTTAIEGPGRYRVGAVPATLASDDAAAGWTLMVAYSAPGLPDRRVGLFTIMERVSNGSSNASAASLDGLCTPGVATREASLTATAMEGDANIADDTLRFSHTLSGTHAGGARVAGPGRPKDNVFGSAITGASGALDTRGSFGDANHLVSSNVAAARQGWDIAHIDATDKLVQSEAVAWIRGTTGSDRYSLLGLALQVRVRAPAWTFSASAAPAVIGVGGTTLVTIAVVNDGDRGAEGVVFSLAEPLPSGVSYIPNTFLLDGAPPPGGAVSAPDALSAGVGLPALPNDGQPRTLTFGLRVDAQPSGAQLTLTPRLDYELASCHELAPAGTTRGAPLALAVAVCGDGLVEGPETCDDGATVNLDGCSALCRVEHGWVCDGVPGAQDYCTATCGDGMIAVGAEACDDGNTAERDGCSALCQPEGGWICELVPGAQGTSASPDSSCQATCGDGHLALGPEGCDDGNLVAHDGCSASCEVEGGWACVGAPGTTSACEASCGDGAIALGAELCDDGNTDEGDGCSSTCQPEPGWICEVAPDALGTPTSPESRCGATCGDGQLALDAEGCDDGDTDDGDGCSAGCGIEPGWSCVGAPGGPSSCAARCGDGQIAAGAEACDDGDRANLDGCSAACEPEPGWSCVVDASALGTPGSPESVCTATCGDGQLAVGAEACDDGGLVSGDGCSEGVWLFGPSQAPRRGFRCLHDEGAWRAM